jgi:hypothetical protein
MWKLFALWIGRVNDEAPKLNPKKTPLLLIDLQNGVVSSETRPYPASEVIERSRKLADAFRAKNAPPAARSRGKCRISHSLCNLSASLQGPRDATGPGSHWLAEQLSSSI